MPYFFDTNQRIYSDASTKLSNATTLKPRRSWSLSTSAKNQNLLPKPKVRRETQLNRSAIARMTSWQSSSGSLSLFRSSLQLSTGPSPSTRCSLKSSIRPDLTLQHASISLTLSSESTMKADSSTWRPCVATIRSCWSTSWSLTSSIKLQTCQNRH